MRNKKVPKSGTKKKGKNNMKFPKKAKLTKNYQIDLIDVIDLINKIINLGDYRAYLIVINFIQSKRDELRSENEILIQKSIEIIIERESLLDKKANIKNIEKINRLNKEYIRIDNKINDNFKKIEALKLEY